MMWAPGRCPECFRLVWLEIGVNIGGSWWHQKCQSDRTEMTIKQMRNIVIQDNVPIKKAEEAKDVSLPGNERTGLAELLQDPQAIALEVENLRAEEIELKGKLERVQAAIKFLNKVVSPDDGHQKKKHPPMTAEQRQQAYRMSDEGMTVVAIAENLNLSPQSVGVALGKRSRQDSLLATVKS